MVGYRWYRVRDSGAMLLGNGIGGFYDGMVLLGNGMVNFYGNMVLMGKFIVSG